MCTKSVKNLPRAVAMVTGQFVCLALIYIKFILESHHLRLISTPLKCMAREVLIFPSHVNICWAKYYYFRRCLIFVCLY
jgi:hypothetical protein